MINEEANFSKYFIKYKHIHFCQGFPVALTKYVNLINRPWSCTILTVHLQLKIVTK